VFSGDLPVQQFAGGIQKDWLWLRKTNRAALLNSVAAKAFGV